MNKILMMIIDGIGISNKEEGNLASKLDDSTKRESLELFKQSLFDKGDILECFYCGNPVSLKGCHMDHFIHGALLKMIKYGIWFLAVLIVMNLKIIRFHQMSI